MAKHQRRLKRSSTGQTVVSELDECQQVPSSYRFYTEGIGIAGMFVVQIRWVRRESLMLLQIPRSLNGCGRFGGGRQTGLCTHPLPIIR
jgi:hypothetical protein